MNMYFHSDVKLDIAFILCLLPFLEIHCTCRIEHDLRRVLLNSKILY